CQQGKSIPFTF
nr:immunoglobulin light chain junction region [Macaca mulatta]